MVRIARLVIPNIPHHVTHRGNRREPVFFDQSDRDLYLSICLKYFQKHELEVAAYCLMDNHVHFVAVPRHKTSLAKAMGLTQMRFAQLLNRKKGWTGHLWSDRFFSTPLDWDHFKKAVRYSERNPVRARLVHLAEEYHWSSARSHVYGVIDPLLSKKALFGLDEEIGDWSQWLSEDDDDVFIKRLRADTKSGRPSGSQAFLEKIQVETGRDATRGKRGRKLGSKVKKRKPPL